MYSWAYFLAVFAIVVHSGSCIKCYNCVSKNNKECQNPLDYPEFKPQECYMNQINQLADKANEVAKSLGNVLRIDIPRSEAPDIPIVCQKVITTVGGEDVIIRGCQVPTDRDASYCEKMGKISSNVITHCSLCDADGCNSGQWLTPMCLLSLLLPALGVTIWTVFNA